MRNLLLLARQITLVPFKTVAPLSHRAMNLAFSALVSIAVAAPGPVAAQVSPSCGDTTPIVLFPPTHEMVSYNLTDVTGVSPESARIFRISQDELFGREGFDAVLVSTITFQVRAERDGYGNGRVYVVEYSVSDARGSSIFCSLQVQVPHSPNRIAVDDGPQACIGVGC